MTKERKDQENTTLGPIPSEEIFLGKVHEYYLRIKTTRDDPVAINELVALIQTAPAEPAEQVYQQILFDSKIIDYLNSPDDPHSKSKVLRLLRTYFVAVTYLQEYLKFEDGDHSIMDVLLHKAEGMGGAAAKTTAVVKHVVTGVSKAAEGSRIFLYLVHAISGLYRFFSRLGVLWRVHQANKTLSSFLQPRLYYGSTFFAAMLDLTGAFIWGIACILVVGQTLDVNLWGLYSKVKLLLPQIGLAGCLSASALGTIILLAAIGMGLEWIAVKIVNLIRARYEYNELAELNQDFNPKVRTNGFTFVRDVKKLQYKEKKHVAARDFLIAVGMGIFASHFLAPAAFMYACLGVSVVLAVNYNFTLQVGKDIYHGLTSAWQAIVASCSCCRSNNVRPKMKPHMATLYGEFPPEGQVHGAHGVGNAAKDMPVDSGMVSGPELGLVPMTTTAADPRSVRSFLKEGQSVASFNSRSP